MAHLIIKPNPDVDEYVIWSTIVEAPLEVGTRAEMTEHLTANPGRGPSDPPAARLDRADRHGSSAVGHTPDGLYAEGWWGDDEYIFQQRGLLKRSDLGIACRLLAEDRAPEVWDLLTPFEDETEVRRG